MATRLRQRARHGTRAVALIAYVAAISCVPVLHAGTEVLRSEASVEIGHTQACPVLHGGDECTIATTVLAALLPPPSVRATLTPDTVQRPPSQPTPFTVRHQVRQNAVRAPPLA
jgi:hypothetical protein